MHLPGKIATSPRPTAEFDPAIADQAASSFSYSFVLRADRGFADYALPLLTHNRRRRLEIHRHPAERPPTATMTHSIEPEVGSVRNAIAPNARVTGLTSRITSFSDHGSVC